MIPQFPQFKKLELSDQPDIEGLTRSFPPFSDFDFVSLWSYDTDHLVEISLLHGNLVLKFQDYLDLEMFYTFIGANEVDATVHTLIEEAKQHKLKSFLKLIPHTSIQSLSGESDLFIQEDRDNFDYIIDAKRFSTFEGRDYHSKRKELNKFVNAYESTSTFGVEDIRSESLQQELLSLFRYWIETFDKNPLESEHELKAISKFFAGVGQYAPLCYCLRVEGKLIGFILAQVVHQQYAMLEFGKWDMAYRGSGEYLQRESVRDLCENHDCLYINYEQDMGLDGLRHAKELCKPIFFLKKYRVAIKAEGATL